VIRKTSSIQKGAENGAFFSSGFTPSILAIQNLQLKGMATFSKGLEPQNLGPVGCITNRFLIS